MIWLASAGLVVLFVAGIAALTLVLNYVTERWPSASFVVLILGALACLTWIAHTIVTSGRVFG